MFGLAGLVLAAYAVRRRYPVLGAVLGVLAAAVLGGGEHAEYEGTHGEQTVSHGANLARMAPNRETRSRLIAEATPCGVLDRGYPTRPR